MKKTQVIGCRVPYELYEKYEIRCLENRVTMSEAMKAAVQKFIEKKKGVY